MAMNIKDEQTHQLARKLAILTGESLTQAVSVAVRERLERIQGPVKQSISERLRQIGEECSPRLQSVRDHAALLYGEDGLPN